MSRRVERSMSQPTSPMNAGHHVPPYRAGVVRNLYLPDQPDVEPARARELTPLEARFDRNEISLLRRTVAETNTGLRDVRMNGPILVYPVPSSLTLNKTFYYYLILYIPQRVNILQRVQCLSFMKP